MFVVDVREGAARIREQAELEAILRALARSGYQLATRNMFIAIWKTAGVESAAGDYSSHLNSQASRFGPFSGPPFGIRPVIGELLFKGNYAFMVLPESSRLICCAIRHSSAEPAVDTFCKDIEGAARAWIDGRRLRGMSFEWHQTSDDTAVEALAYARGLVRRLPRRLRQPAMNLKELAPEYTEQQKAAAFLLLHDDVRGFLLHLAQVMKALTTDAITLAPQEQVSQLLDVGLIRSEYLISCRKDSHTLCTLPDSDVLDTSGGQIRCPVCDRSYRSELVREIYVLTDLGRQLLEGSRWMQIWITELLYQRGLSSEQIRWNVGASGEDLDIRVTLFGRTVFFELKDREFGLGDVYPFTMRVNRYGGDIGIVATTERVAEDAVSFFKELNSQPEETRGALIVWLEAADGITKGIEEQLESISRLRIREVVRAFSNTVGLDMWPPLEAWLSRQAVQAASPRDER